MISTPVDLVMRSKNEGHYLRETLRAVRRQTGSWQATITVIDSGSTDNSLAILQEEGVERLVQIRPEEYIAGRVLNQGMELTRTEWVVYLNADATPANDHWLADLMTSALAVPQTGAAFGAQVPRPDCWGVYAHDYDRCFGPQRESAQWAHFFSMVNSVVYRPAWEKERFRDDLRYAEDDEWSRRLKAAGWTVPYAEKAQVIHSHNYTAAQAYRRAYGDLFAAAATGGYVRPGLLDPIRRVFLPALKDAGKDLVWLGQHHRLPGWPRALVTRMAQRAGKTQGYRDGWQHYHGASPS